MQSAFLGTTIEIVLVDTRQMLPIDLVCVTMAASVYVQVVKH